MQNIDLADDLGRYLCAVAWHNLIGKPLPHDRLAAVPGLSLAQLEDAHELALDCELITWHAMFGWRLTDAGRARAAAYETEQQDRSL